MTNSSSISNRLDAIEAEIDKLLSSQSSDLPLINSDILIEAHRLATLPVANLLKRGGKRWRPLVMTLCCEALNGGDAALPLTPIPEIIHNGTLVVDDIEDGSDMRRGEAAVHRAFGIDAALNSGNWAYFLPLLLLEKNTDNNESLRLALYRTYGESLRSVHLGQALDIQWHRDKEFKLLPTEDDYHAMCRLKTGSLASCAAKMGVFLAGKGKIADEAGKIWEKAGVGFQIMDDVTNLKTGNPGKERGDDIVEGKKSLPVILFAREPEGRKRIVDAFSSIRSSCGNEKEKIEQLINDLTAAGVLEEAEKRAVSLLKEAEEGLLVLFPSGDPLSSMIELLRSFS